MKTIPDTDTLIERGRAYLVNAKLTGKQIERLERLGYFDAPAAMRHHLNRPHGLVEHCLNVTDYLLHFDVFEERASAFRVGMLHDLVKCLCYKVHHKDDGSVYYSYIQPPYPGHGIASALIAADNGIFLSPRERAAIVWHMGAYGLDDNSLKEYQASVYRYPREILFTHACDNFSAVQETLAERGIDVPGIEVEQ